MDRKCGAETESDGGRAMNSLPINTRRNRETSPMWGLGGPMNPLYLGPYMCKDWVWRRIRATATEVGR